jgi:methionyl aminopeptidase
MLTFKSSRELGYMRVAGRTVAAILDELENGLIYPGASTGELDRYVERRCQELGVEPAFKGYRGFPSSICVSVNDEVAHGVPSDRKVLENGDIVGLDFGVRYQGWYGDSARTIAVGDISRDARQLLEVTSEGLMRGISQCREGNRVFDIGLAVQNYVEGFGFSVVREFVGHGIGRALHEEPQVPNFGRFSEEESRDQGLQLKVGMVLAIEPMVNLGGHEVKILGDGWTAVTLDRSLSAHFEHTVAITENGPEILTQI